MKQNKFTIIIPTRERADTLYWTLKTCVEQSYNNLEIIVSDNFSQDNTREIVDSFNDSRIRYINTGKRMAMSQNWEFAINHVQQGYVIFLGDDDGFLLNTFSIINEIINRTGVSYVSWEASHYIWSDVEVASRNNIDTNYNHDCYLVDSESVLKKFLNRETSHYKLINLYVRGVVDIDILQQIKKEQQSEVFFRSNVPDVYAAILLTSRIKEFVFCNIPLGLAAGSKNSNSGSTYNKKYEKAQELFIAENETLSYHPYLVPMKSFNFHIWSAALDVFRYDSYFKKYTDEKSIMKLLLAHTYHDIRHSDSYQEEVDKLNIMANNSSLGSYFNEITIKYPYEKMPIHSDIHNDFEYGVNEVFNRIRLHGDKFNVKNVYDTAILLSNLLGLNGTYKIVYYSQSTFLYKKLMWVSRKIKRLAETRFMNSIKIKLN